MVLCGRRGYSCTERSQVRHNTTGVDLVGVPGVVDDRIDSAGILGVRGDYR